MQTRHGQPASREAASGRGIGFREQITEHHCIQGWSGIAKWGGTPMAKLPEGVKPDSSAKYAVFYSHTDGQDGGRNYDVHTLRNMKHEMTLLAYEMNGQALNIYHGAPLRLRCENELGFQAGQVERIDRVRRGLQEPGCRTGWLQRKPRVLLMARPDLTVALQSFDQT